MDDMAVFGGGLENEKTIISWVWISIWMNRGNIY